MRASLQSIATALGLSAATVSNVYNRPELVAEQTRQRVLREAARVGYHGPDPAARHLRRGRTDTIGLLLTDELPFAFSDQAAVGFLAGVAEACAWSGHNLVLLPAGAPDQPQRTSSIRTASMDGLIVYSVADDDPHLRAACDRGLPVTVVDQPAAGPDWDWVGPDDRAAAQGVGQLMGEAGHRRIGVITARLSGRRRNGPVMDLAGSTYYLRRQRIEGFRAAVAAFGVEAAQVPVEERFESSERAGAEALSAILARHPDLTAVFCLSDVLALGALARARELGLDVPGDLSVVGFDDIPQASAAGLTTVHQPLSAKGRVAGEFLVRRLQRADDASLIRHHTLSTVLQVRRSLSAPGR
ncbi:LacI family DNA-binding transcriptional regulator [Phytohabitans kaempferiae]|uniref:LacI family DNA-binding transcriptional regulator n=1 Tax=Phytohabitans kaempferiae TaxID=1620943 RepID=A0ABV6M2T7_9ACTN